MSTAENANNAAATEDPELQWVTFLLEGETYGINVMAVQEVLRYSEIAPVPGASNFVLGVINLRGNVITVIDTRHRFGLPTGETTADSRIVVIEASDQVVGLLVDSVAEVVYIRQSEIETSPNAGNDENSEFIQGVCNKGETLLILIDYQKILEGY